MNNLQYCCPDLHNFCFISATVTKPSLYELQAGLCLSVMSFCGFAGGVRDVQNIISNYFADQDPRVRTAALKAMVESHTEPTRTQNPNSTASIKYIINLLLFQFQHFPFSPL